MTFKEHTYLRRQALSSHWTVKDMVYGAIGTNPNTGKPMINSHFSQMNSAFPAALPMALSQITQNWGNIVYPHPQDFEDLYERVNKYIASIKGVGLVVLYDVSLNIGCNLYPKVLPDKYVYLHGATCPVFKSAAKLFPESKLDPVKVDVKLFQDIFPYESAMEIEDILCCYNDEIMNDRFTTKSLALLPSDDIAISS